MVGQWFSSVNNVKTRHLFGKTLLVMMLFLLVSSAAVVNAQTDSQEDGQDDEVEDEFDDTTIETSDDNHDDDDDGVSDDDESRNERNVQVYVTETTAEIESKLESNGTENSFKIEVAAGLNGLEFKLEYETENTTLETEKEFEVQFKEIVEFIDDNGNGVYDDESDTDVQTMELASFNPIDYRIVNTTNGDLHMFNVTTMDEVFTAIVYAAGEFADINGTIVAPSQIKIDVIIRNFNYLNDTSQLALKVKLEVSGETSYDDETEDEEDGRATNEAAIDLTVEGMDGFFSWKESAEIDGITYPVNASIDEVQPGEQKLYLNYVRGNEIIHDPKLGLENILVLSSDLPSGTDLPGLTDLLENDYLLPAIIVGAIVVVGLVVAVKRRA